MLALFVFFATIDLHKANKIKIRLGAMMGLP